MTAIIDEINSNHARHVITIEDPIEYLHVNKKGLVRQRQIGPRHGRLSLRPAGRPAAKPRRDLDRRNA